VFSSKHSKTIICYSYLKNIQFQIFKQFSNKKHHPCVKKKKKKKKKFKHFKKKILQLCHFHIQIIYLMILKKKI